MTNEANKIFSHDEIVTLLHQELSRSGLLPVRELRFESGRVADLAYFSDTGGFHIIEVKSEFRPYYLDLAWRKYAPYCHYLNLAIPTCEPLLRSVLQEGFSYRTGKDEVGIIQVDWEGPRISRRPTVRALPLERLRAIRSLYAAKLAAGEMLPGLKLATAAEPPNKNGGAP